jgi:tRNA 2-selenouridine synthase
MIDVRAPVEFQSGALPFSQNLVLMSDDERQKVGICYREQGSQAAISLGHQLVDGEKKQRRINAWIDFLTANPNAVLYCARGGLRSKISQQWLSDAGVICPRIEGGYKSLRGFLINQTVNLCGNEKFVLLSGMTGTGKTDIIKSLSRSIDLEGAANHKGSSFGRPLDQQPSQVDFENKIALDLMAVKQKYPQRSIILEDESRNIGSRHLPTPLTNAMNRSPMIVIELSFDERIERIFQEYVIDRYQKTLACNQDNAEDVFADYLTDSLLRVQKRLGDERTTHILKLMKEAIQIQHKDNFNYHRQWLIAITRDYYDPMYVYQLKKREQKIVFKGNYQDVKEWLSELP